LSDLIESWNFEFDPGLGVDQDRRKLLIVERLGFVRVYYAVAESDDLARLH
jgi:hypothetical protein